MKVGYSIYYQRRGCDGNLFANSVLLEVKKELRRRNADVISIDGRTHCMNIR